MSRMTVQININEELLDSLNKYRKEDSAIQTIFNEIKKELAEEEVAVCRCQELIYNLENLDMIIEDDIPYTVDKDISEIKGE